MQYKAAIIGLGNIAWRFDARCTTGDNCLTHAGAYLRNEQTELIGGCSPNEADRRDFAAKFSLPVYADHQELFRHLQPDIVSICSPNHCHYEQALFCIEHDVPMIWLEKPPTLKVSEIDHLLAEIKRHQNKSRVLVNYQRRFEAPYRELRRIFQEKKIGQGRLIEINYSRGLETNGSHLLDILFYIVGDGTDWKLEWLDDSAAASPSFILRLTDGLPVHVTGTELPYHNIDIRLTGDEGRAAVIHGGATAIYERRVERDLFPGFYRLRSEGCPERMRPDNDTSMEPALQNLLKSRQICRLPDSNLKSSRKMLTVLGSVRAEK